MEKNNPRVHLHLYIGGHREVQDGHHSKYIYILSIECEIYRLLYFRSEEHDFEPLIFFLIIMSERYVFIDST